MIRFEPLELRTLLSASLSVGNDVNVTRLPGNQEEGAISVDPTNPSRLFALSNTEEVTGLAAAFSSDGGQSWHSSVIATDSSPDLESACCDPTVSFDQFGNLFIGYVNADEDAAIIAMSTDGGKTFTQIGRFTGDIDQPTLTTGSGAVWMTYARGNSVAVVGAPVIGLGEVGKFTKPRMVPGSSGGTFGDIAIGPRGQVMVAYEINHSDADTTSVLAVSIDPDGFGKEGFGPSRRVAKVNVGPFEKLPAQPIRAVDAEISIGYDLSNGPYRGRLYAVYTHRTITAGHDTNIMIRYSDNNGTTWSASQRVNDDTGGNSQFLPKMSVDPTTGLVGIGWHDSRNDPHNKDADYFATAATPLGSSMDIAPNVKVTQGTSNAIDAQADIDFGDYTGISFYGGVLHPFWADNSNSTGDNPDGTRKAFDMYTSSIAVSGDVPVGDPGSALPGGIASTFKGKALIKSGKSYSFKVVYSDQAILDPTSLDSNDVLIAGPNGFSQLATLKSKSVNSSATQITATYVFAAPDGKFDAADNGNYLVTLVSGQVADLLGKTDAQSTIGQITVAAKT